MNLERISQRQLALMFFTLLISTVVFFMPQIAAREVEQDAWISALLASFWGIFIVLVVVALGRRFPNRTLTGYIPLIVGKPLGFVLNALYSIWFIFIGAGIVAEFVLFMNITVLPRTPIVVFIITFLALSWYAVRGGLEVWVRVNEMLFWVIAVSLLATVVLPLNMMDFRRLLPVGEHRWGSLLAASLISGTWRGEVFLAAMFLPALTSFKNTTRNLILSVILVGVALSAIEFAGIAVFGGIAVGQMEFPEFYLARVISMAEILQRLEVLVVIVWLFGTFIKINAFLYCSTRATAETVGFKHFYFLLLPMTVLFGALAYNEYTNSALFVDFLTKAFPGFGILSFQLTIPLLLLIIAWVRGVREDQKLEEQ